MKVFIALLLIGGIFVSFAVFKLSEKPKIVHSPQIENTISEQKTLQSTHAKRFIFVPYWTFQDSITNISQFDQLIYFGVSANTSGIDTSDPGFSKVATFTQIVPSEKEKILTIRMLDSVVNADVIKDIKSQDKIIAQVTTLATRNGYDGILLDFEINAIPFQKVIDRITAFYKRSEDAYHAKSLKFYVTSYGDTYYRVRPYDMKQIGALADGVFIMAYDFHKANGDPGPNFPLSGRSIYGYDFEDMIRDFSAEIPKEKLLVTFGLYGYDWKVDEKGKAVGKGSSLSSNKIEQNFIKNCLYENCTIQQDLTSSEKEIRYKDSDNNSHIIWFEDRASIEKKKVFLNKMNITSHGYWAYSYYSF